MAKKTLKVVKGNAKSAAPVKKVGAVKKVAAPAAKAKAEKAPKTTRNTGRTTGLKIAAYQDKLMKENSKNKFSDEKLARLMREEFPEAIEYTVEHVRGIRSQFNNGARASQDGVAPEKPVKEYDDNGNVVERRRGPAASGEKGAAKKGAAKKTAKKTKAAPEPEEDEEEEEEEEDLDEDSDDGSEEDDE